MMNLKKSFTYIDLFAGIGGFHCAMDDLSDGKAVCLYASEIDSFAQKVYEDNFAIKPFGDIRKFNPSSFDAPDVVCAGFPCQTFSKAGKRKGFKDPRGTLFREIIRIIEFYPFDKRPKFLILENVRNLVSHDNGDTWRTIKYEIENVGYRVIPTPVIASPKDVGTPQLRDRAIILAVRKDLYDGPLDFKFERREKNNTSIYDILDNKKTLGSKKMTERQIFELQCWEEFVHNVNRKVFGFPIWSDEFGKNYRIDNLPQWKQDFISSNRKLYLENQEFIDKWLAKWNVRQTFTPTNRKFEWQVGGKNMSVFEGIIQYRPSGIRVKLPTESPALVAMVHLPFIGKEKRSISLLEGKRLQNFPDNFKFDESPALAFRQLGNAVNVKVISTVFRQFLDYIGCIVEEE